MVGLSCTAKGRAQSPSLNRLLRRMLPNVLAGDLAPRGFWVCSARNPMDDPTRDRPIRAPCEPLPGWWDAAAAGRW
eukprot:1087249-Lingulodinium_polyedra.AAC.1